jgi:hypothetical protein
MDPTISQGQPSHCLPDGTITTHPLPQQKTQLLQLVDAQSPCEKILPYLPVGLYPLPS